MKIESLTKEQEAYLPIFREEYRKKSLSVEPIGKEQAIESVKNLYRKNGFKEPITILYGRSPFECNLLINAAKKYWCGEKEFTLKDEHISELKEKSEIKYFSNSISGGLDNYWLAFYKFAEYIGAKYSEYVQEKLDAYVNYADSCGFLYAFENIAFVSDRPSEIHFDDRRLLHNANGPSVKFRDGFSLYSWHGIRIPKHFIEGNLTPQEALKTENTEQRRAACEIIGWAKIIRLLDAVTIDKHHNPIVGELIEIDLPEIGKEKYLRVMCGTAREFALPVPPEMQRATQAQAWLNWEEDENKIIPKVRT